MSAAVGRGLKTSRVYAGKRTTAASANGRTLRCDHELLFQGEHALDDVNRPGRINNVLHEVQAGRYSGYVRVGHLNIRANDFAKTRALDQINTGNVRRVSPRFPGGPPEKWC